MLKRIFIKLFLFAIFYVLFLLGGCSYVPTEVLPEYIHNIYIPVFVNKTSKYGLEDKLTEAVIDEFLRDGKLGVTNKSEADGMLLGEIVEYRLEPISYDANNVVEQYKLWVVVNLTFWDLKKNEILWRDYRHSVNGGYQGGIEEYVRYYVTSQAGEVVETEEEAQDRLVQTLSEDIVKRTAYGWKSEIESELGIQ